MASRPVLSDHSKGLLLTSLGVLAISPDGLLTRLITAPAFDVTYWRGLYFGFAVFLWSLIRYRGRFLDKVFAIGLPGCLLAVLYAVGNLSFIYSLKHTAVANTLFILSSTPLFAAIISWIFFREKIRFATSVAIIFVAVGIGVICFGKGPLSTSWAGNAAGLLAAATLAAGFCVVRVNKTLDFLPAFGLGGFVAAIMISPFVETSTATVMDHGYLFLMGSIMLPIANALMFLGPRYLPAAEVGLVMLLESICGPLWVWLVLAENPGAYTLAGGAVVLLTLAVHANYRLKVESKPKAYLQ
ncbi:MAG: DMT family transporter [Pseudomonadota bacterium]